MTFLGDDPYLWADVMRVLVAAMAVWTAALALRIGWLRYRRRDWPSVLVYGSYAGALLLLSGLRWPHVGQPPIPDLWVAAVVVVFGFLGMVFWVQWSYFAARRWKGDR